MTGETVTINKTKLAEIIDGFKKISEKLEALSK